MFPIGRIVVCLPTSLINLSPGSNQAFRCFPRLMIVLLADLEIFLLSWNSIILWQESSKMKSSGKTWYHQETTLSEILEATQQLWQLGTSRVYNGKQNKIEADFSNNLHRNKGRNRENWKVVVEPRFVPSNIFDKLVSWC